MDPDPYSGKKFDPDPEKNPDQKHLFYTHEIKIFHYISYLN